MTAHAAPRPRSSHEHSIRRLVVTNRQVAEAIALVDRNGLDYVCVEWPAVVARQAFPLVLVPAPLAAFPAGTREPEVGR